MERITLPNRVLGTITESLYECMSQNGTFPKMALVTHFFKRSKGRSLAYVDCPCTTLEYHIGTRAQLSSWVSFPTHASSGKLPYVSRTCPVYHTCQRPGVKFLTHTSVQPSHWGYLGSKSVDRNFQSLSFWVSSKLKKEIEGKKYSRIF